MEGKMIEESKAKQRADREAEEKTGAKDTSTPSHQKIKVPYTDPSGRAFMLEVDASLLTSSQIPTSNPAQPFMGIASINPNDAVSSTEFFEHSGFNTTFKFDLAYIMDLPTIPNNTSICPTSSTVIAKSTETNPFYIDSGASGHLTPDREDFFELRPIQPHPV